jgi:hypothetical protein
MSFAEEIENIISPNHKLKELLMTIADDIAVIKAAVTAPAVPVTVDLTPVETAIAAVKSDTGAILADLTPTPVTPPPAA